MKKQRRGRRRGTVGSVLLLPIGYLFLLAAGPVLSAAADLLAPGHGLVQTVASLALVVSVIFSTIVVHELGHAYAMQRLRWPIHMIAAFPVAYHTRLRRFTWWAGLDGDIGGVVTASPPALRPRWADIVVYGAGPFANLLCAAIVLPVVALVRHPIAEAILGAFGSVSMLIAIGNLVPFKTWSGKASDGARIITLLLDYLDDARDRAARRPRKGI